MKKIISTTALLSLIIILLPGCEAIGSIFKAGVWVGVLAVVGVIGLIIFLATRGKK